MSTCPKCHGHLTTGHRCPRTNAAVAMELIATALVGGLAAMAFVAVLDPHQITIDLDFAVFALGALAALAVHTVFTRWPRRGTR